MSFPGNVVTVLRNHIESLDFGNPEDELTVLGRPLRPSDPNFTVGVYAMDWRPDDHEIGHVEPSCAHYEYRIDAIVKNTNEEDGREAHGNLSKAIRAMLYRDSDLRAELGQTSEEYLGVIERVQKWGVRQQRFFANDIRGEFIFLAAIEFYVDVESA